MEKFDVVGIGNAIVDVLSYCDDEFIVRHQLRKSAMTLVDEARAEQLYSIMGPAEECSGGSAANTMAGIASCGGRSAFIGKVYNDSLGKIFKHDLNSIGVHFDTPPASEGKSTGRCMILVTPDAHRTMNTFIGACSMIRENDIDEKLISDSKVLYIEGYLWDEPETKNSLRKAITLAKKHNKKVAFTLSDLFCVERHHAEFMELVRNDIDILFSNEGEIKALFKTDNVEHAISELKAAVEVGIVTRSEHGSVIVSASETVKVPAEKIDELVDTTGAGDLYAAGFLYGFTRGSSLEKCARLGGLAAAEVIQQLGARLLKPLKPIVAKAA